MALLSAGRREVIARRSLLLLLGAAACTPSARVSDLTATTRGAVTTLTSGSVMSADTLRTGWYSDQPALDPVVVGSSYFGQLFDAPVDGQIYAQPLYSNGVVLVATETNTIYGLDAATGASQWTRNLGTPWRAADINCSNLAPTVGVTGTPAIDPDTQTAYLLSKTYASGTSGAAAWLAHAIDLATGAERAGFPVTIAGAASNEPTQLFNPTQQLQRPGLLLLDGVVYAAFGGHCDLPPYTGWIVGVSTKGALTTMWTSEAGAARTVGGGIWMSGGALVSDGPGQILFATSNDASSSTTPVPGRSPPQTLSEAIVRLAVQADGSLAATDFFSPGELPALNKNDTDLGSGSPIALPATFGTAAHPNLLAHAGKEGYLYLLDREDLGGYLQGTAGGDRILQRLGPDGGVWAHPGVWPGDGGYVYVPVVSGCASPTDPAGCLRAYQYGISGDGSPTLSPSAVSTSSFGYGSSSVVVTSDGTRSGSALLWTIWSSGAMWQSGSGPTSSQLRAYDAVPSGDALNLRYLASIGTAAKFTAPAVGDGRVYVGTGDGHVLGFGVTGTPALRAQGVAFAPTAVGDVSLSNVQVVASGPVKVMGLSTSGDFSVTGAAPSVPFTMATGDTVVIPVEFRPASDGPDIGNLQVTTDHGTFSIPLTGIGQSQVPTLVPSPTVVAFAPLVMGSTSVTTVSLTNASDAPMTISAIATPSAPFSIAGLPPVGTVLPVDGSFTATITFAPTSLGSSSGYFSVTASGSVAAVAVEGSALAGGKLRLSPDSLQLGLLHLGEAVTSDFQLTNDGDVALVIEKSQPPTATAFVAQTTLPEGTVIAPGASIEELIRVSPTVVGATTDVWRLNADDGQGLRAVTLSVTGVAPPPAAPPASSSSSTMTSTTTTDAPAQTVESSETAEPVQGNGEVIGHAACGVAPGDARSSGLGGFAMLAIVLAVARRQRR